jgi:hypothetical protein
MRLVFMLYPYPRQNFGSTSPVVLHIHVLEREIVYPENNREVMPKLFLESEQNMETNRPSKKHGRFETDMSVDMQ